MRKLTMTGFALILLCACSAPTEIAPGVSLVIDQVAPSADGRRITYEYSITNASADSVWIPACGGVIRPDVAVMLRGQLTDTYSGSRCTANLDNGPAPIAPGAQYVGQSEVQSLSGASFVPFVVVSLVRTLRGSARKVTGGMFAAF